MAHAFISLSMIYDLSNPYEVEQFKNHVKKCLDKSYVVTLSRKFPQRSLKQNNYLYLILSYFSAESGYSVDEVKIDYFKKTCNPDIFYRERENKRGTKIKYLRSTSELDTGEMTLAIHRFRLWSEFEAGIYLPSAEDGEFLIHCEKEVERNKEFIYM